MILNWYHIIWTWCCYNPSMSAMWNDVIDKPVVRAARMRLYDIVSDNPIKSKNAEDVVFTSPDGYIIKFG